MRTATNERPRVRLGQVLAAAVAGVAAEGDTMNGGGGAYDWLIILLYLTLFAWLRGGWGGHLP